MARPRSLEPQPKLIRLAGGIEVPLLLVRKPGCKRYILRVTKEGAARVTLPWRGNSKEAIRFVETHLEWLQKQWIKHSKAKPGVEPWVVGHKVMFRGELIPIIQEISGAASLAGVPLRAPPGTVDFKRAVMELLLREAGRILPERVRHFAQLHSLPIKRITIRNQRTRWGSCSCRGGISLNWRLIQTPPFVTDYIILHELMHLLEMNHSARFWAAVEKVCPNYREAEKWLKEHGELLR